MSLNMGCSMFLASCIIYVLVPSIGSVSLVHEASPITRSQNSKQAQGKKAQFKQKAIPREQSFVRHAAASPEIPMLDPTAGVAAIHAQSELVDAVVAETKQSASAQEAASSMAQALSKKASNLIEAAHAFIEKSASKATVEINHKRQDANKLAEDSAAFELKIQQQTKDDTVKVVLRLQKASTQEEIIKAAELSDAAAMNAITQAGEIRKRAKQITQEFKQKGESILATQANAHEELTDRLNSVKPSIISMATELEEVGKKVSAKMNAKEAGDAILKKTAQAAAQLQKLVAEFEIRSRTITQSLDAVTTTVISEVDALAAKAGARSEEAAQQLVTSGTRARTQLNDAKAIWVEACNHAVQIVNDAAGAVPLDDLFHDVKRQEDTSSPKPSTQAMNVAYKAIFFALFLSILSVLVGLRLRPDKLLASLN